MRLKLNVLTVLFGALVLGAWGDAIAGEPPGGGQQGQGQQGSPEQQLQQAIDKLDSKIAAVQEQLKGVDPESTKGKLLRMALARLQAKRQEAEDAKTGKVPLSQKLLNELNKAVEEAQAVLTGDLDAMATDLDAAGVKIEIEDKGTTVTVRISGEIPAVVTNFPGIFGIFGSDNKDIDPSPGDKATVELVVDLPVFVSGIS
ncbi:hypothetical protein ACFL5O_02370 [Myxococcota bacterium]